MFITFTKIIKRFLRTLTSLESIRKIVYLKNYIWYD